MTVAHGDADWSTDPQLQIETSARSDRRSDSELVRAALARWLWDPTDIDAESDAAVALQFRARVHDQRRRAAQAPMSDRDIRVEGTSQPFRYVETEGRWAAVRRTATRTITVTGRGISPDALDLIPVAAPFRDLLAAEQ